ncbi:MAG: SDR family NAD(P)-dependent oxidoreductase [candidate division Zixibacteria bacterium]|nr:SDR family NAD(P)-dependent oxidoreductase [candidate division Zixibacteria bacterium]
MFKDKVVAITGAGGGLGSAICRAFGEAGCKIVLLERNADRMNEIAGQLRDKGIDAYTVEIDVIDPGKVKEAAGKIEKEPGHIDILVNNAGGFANGPIEEFSDEDWDKMIKLNLYGPFYVTKYFLPLLKKSRGAHIFNISSIGGKVGLKNGTAYSASKFGLRGLSESLSEELRKESIRVTTVFPHMMNSAGDEIEPEKRNKIIEPADVANQVTAAAASPDYVNIPEIIVYPLASGVVKRDNLA